MKPIRNFLLLGVFIFSATALGKGAPQGQQPQQSPTIASIVDLEISKIERQVVDAAEAMPAEKFNFSPESLNISGSQLQGCAHVRFAGQAYRHFQLLPLVAAYR
jgi:hypothetical protein